MGRTPSPYKPAVDTCTNSTQRTAAESENSDPSRSEQPGARAQAGESGKSWATLTGITVRACPTAGGDGKLTLRWLAEINTGGLPQESVEEIQKASDKYLNSLWEANMDNISTDRGATFLSHASGTHQEDYDAATEAGNQLIEQFGAYIKTHCGGGPGVLEKVREEWGREPAVESPSTFRPQSH